MKNTFTTTKADARKTLVEWLHQRFSLSWKQARDWVKSGQVLLDGKACNNPRQKLERGQQIEIQVSKKSTSSQKPSSKSRSSMVVHPIIRYVDADIVIVEKPAGLTTMRHESEIAEQGRRAKEFLPKTCEDLLPALLAGQQVRSVHRLDKDTSGLLVFALTPQAENSLNQQFKAHTISRKYLAIVRGHAKNQRIESKLVRDRGDGRRGSGEGKDAKRAVTDVRVLERLGEFTLVECRLETGRTHQIRIHLGEAGTPLCGEHIYDRPIHGKPEPDTSHVKRIALHAATLGFQHPTTGEQVEWTSTLPDDLNVLLTQLRNRL